MERRRRELRKFQVINLLGFGNSEEARRAASIVEVIGFSTENVKAIKNESNPDYLLKDIRRCVVRYDFSNNTLILDVPPEVITLEAMAYGLAHANSPLIPANERFFGGRQNRQKANAHAFDIAYQSKETRVFLTPRHRFLFNTTEENNWGVFIEETHAIMMALRISDPQRLQKVEERQIKKMESMHRRPIGIFDGITQTAIDLMVVNGLTHIVNSEELDDHIAKVKRQYFPASPGSLHQID